MSDSKVDATPAEPKDALASCTTTQIPTETCLEWLLRFHRAFPLWSVERKDIATGTEIRRWFTQGAVEVDGNKVKALDKMPPGVVVLFPKGERKTTLSD
jgi:hypothetical protein